MYLDIPRISTFIIQVKETCAFAITRPALQVTPTLWWPEAFR